MTVKLLAQQHLECLSLKGSCTGSSESLLVKMPHCWKSHVAAQMNLGLSLHNYLSHRKIVMVDLKFGIKCLYKQNREVMRVFGRIQPMTEKINNLWFCFVAVTCVFRSVPQLVSSLLPQLQL